MHFRRPEIYETRSASAKKQSFFARLYLKCPDSECSNDWGGRGYDDSVPGDGTKTTPSGDKTT